MESIYRFNTPRGFGNMQTYVTNRDGREYVVKIATDPTGSGNSQFLYYSLEGKYPLENEINPGDHRGGEAFPMQVGDYLEQGWELFSAPQ